MAAKETAGKAKAAPKAKSAKAKSSGGTVTVQQIGSPIRREHSQRETLVGLKLNKLHRTATLPDSPSVRGMIAKVAHLVRVLDGAA